MSGTPATCAGRAPAATASAPSTCSWRCSPEWPWSLMPATRSLRSCRWCLSRDDFLGIDGENAISGSFALIRATESLFSTENLENPSMPDRCVTPLLCATPAVGLSVTSFNGRCRDSLHRQAVCSTRIKNQRLKLCRWKPRVSWGTWGPLPGMVVPISLPRGYPFLKHCSGGTPRGCLSGY